VTIERQRALLVDFDGVVRCWTGEGALSGERSAGLPAGAIDAVAYSLPSYGLAKLGIISDCGWRADVCHHLRVQHGDRAEAAVRSWTDDRGQVDPDVVELLRQARGFATVALVSETTDILPADLERHDLTGLFHYVCYSAELGVTKPAPMFFKRVLQIVGCDATDALFVDDMAVNVAGAQRAGIPSHLFSGASEMALALRAAGINTAGDDRRSLS
jgi:putative hydrolase of the HAD superfamily